MNPSQFYQWFEVIEEGFTDFKKWQAMGLAMISYGILKARCSQASLIAEELPEFGKASTVERRIQRWIANERIDTKEACVNWVKWVMENYEGDIAYLLVDESKLGKRIGCLMISLAFKRRAIPLIWKCYRADSAADYPKEGQVNLIVNMLSMILPVIPEEMQIIVQADRGIGNSSNLMKKIVELELFFLFRIQRTDNFTPKNGKRATLKSVAKPGEEWHAAGKLFIKNQVKCHVHIIWDEGHEEPWCVATNMEGLTGREYANRVWQEESFRDLKSGGWQWHKNLSRNPNTIERLLLPMTIAYAWCISLGVWFAQLDEAVQRKIDYIRKDVKYSIFRSGLRYFKRMFSLEERYLYFRIGPFLASS